jgi:hypothetical protein
MQGGCERAAGAGRDAGGVERRGVAGERRRLLKRGARPPGGLALALAALATAGCATQRPVLYPNATLEERGMAAAQRDVDECMARANAYVKGESATGKVAAGTVGGAAAGGVVGAAGGAVVGEVGRGAGVGAATGATAGLLHGIFGARRPDPVTRAFVERCLRERGLEPIGWR